jgi:hypothetical protein
MPKVKISEYSATANSNTDVASINIDEGCAPSGINNAIRAVMGHLKDFQQGTNGDPFNGPVNGTLGATTASTANVTTLTTSSTVTHNGGTANGVAYLNGSKVLTTGNALVFDGTNLLVGAANFNYAANGVGLRSSGYSYFTVTSGSPLLLNRKGTTGSIVSLNYEDSNVGAINTDGTNISLNKVSGITFPATQSASSDANTLDDYEEGTWTPTDLSGASLSFTTTLGRYTKVGNQVTAWAWIQYPVTASGLDNTIGGLPFNIANETALRGGFALGFSQTASVGGGILSPNTAYFVLVTSAGLNVTNATLSTVIVSFVVIYHVA